MIHGVYEKVSPRYLAVEVIGQMIEGGGFALLNEEAIDSVVDNTETDAEWWFNARKGLLFIKCKGKTHTHSWCIGQVVVWNSFTQEFEVWGKSEFEHQFKKV